MTREELSKLSDAELSDLYNKRYGQDATVTTTAQPTAETDLTGMAGATLKDMGKGAYHGSVEGAASIGGAPADFAELAAQGGNAAKRYFDPLTPPRQPQEPRLGALPGSARMQQNIDDYISGLIGGRVGKPESGLGKLTERGFAYAPALAGGKEAYLARPLTRIAGPMAGESVMNAATKDTPYEDAATVAGALMGSPLAARAVTPFRAPNPMRFVQAQKAKAAGLDATSAADRTGNRVLATIQDATGRPSWASQEAMDRQMTAYALKKMGVDKDTFLSPSGDKTVIPARMAELGKSYDAFNTAVRPRLSPKDQLLFDNADQAGKRPFIESVLSTKGKKDFAELNQQYGIATDLEKASQKNNTGRLSGGEVASATKDNSDRILHNMGAAADSVKGKVDPMNDKILAGLLGVAASGGAGNAAYGLLGDQSLYGLGGAAAAGLGAGGLAAHYGPGYLKNILALAGPALNRRAVQRALSNQAIPQRMRDVGPRLPVGATVYTTNQRNPQEDE